MKKLLPVFFALVLLLILLPAPEARAEYALGGECPSCHENTISFGHTTDDYGHFPYCSKPECNWNLSADVVPVEPHSGSPTCTKEGYCSVCGYWFGKPLGHSFTNYVSNNNATCTADGTKTAKCDRCDVTDTITRLCRRGDSPAHAEYRR